MEFSDIVGMTLKEITIYNDDEKMILVTEDGRQFCMEHFQDCCESVYIEDIFGDLKDLIGSPIIIAEEVWNNDILLVDGVDQSDSFTWTFYKLDTEKGGVTIRWFGSSNGYYSEHVNFYEIES